MATSVPFLLPSVILNKANVMVVNMTHKTVRILALMLLFCVVGLFFASNNNVNLRAATECPSSLPARERLDCLYKRSSELKNQRKSIESTLKNVRAQEGDIQSQIDELNAQIAANENELSQKQIEIELASIEIANIGEDITETKNRIDTLKQESQTSMQKVNEIAMLAYKVNSIPIWYLLAQNDLISTLEMLRYFDYISQQEKVRLAQFSNLHSQLSSEEKVLGVAQSSIIEKRDAMEAANLEIIELKSTLSTQRDKQKTLLSSLAQQEKALAAERSKLIAQQNAADRQALSIAIQLFEANKLGNGTPVRRGDIIGREGFTGCSFGAHIHYGFISGTGSYYTNVNPFSSGLLRQSGSYIVDGRAKAPLPGMLMTGGFHDNYSIDAVSTSAGNQDSSRKYQIITPVCWQTKGRTYSLTGWGAPIYAALEGKVYYGTDSMGGRYAIVDHGNVFNGKKLKSIYWHLDGPDAKKKVL